MKLREDFGSGAAALGHGAAAGASSALSSGNTQYQADAGEYKSSLSSSTGQNFAHRSYGAANSSHPAVPSLKDSGLSSQNHSDLSNYHYAMGNHHASIGNDSMANAHTAAGTYHENMSKSLATTPRASASPKAPSGIKESVNNLHSQSAQEETQMPAIVEGFRTPAPIRRVQEMRRLFEAASRDKKSELFYADLAERFDSGATRMQDISFRALIENFVPGGRELVQSWNPALGGSPYTLDMALSSASLMEDAGAVSSSAFSNVSKQIVYSTVMQAFEMEANVFSPLVSDVPTQFNGERIPGIAQMGDGAEVIPELGTYPLLGVSEDYIDTPLTVKRGIKMALSKESVFFDRTGILVERCGDVGTFLGLNKEKRIIDAVIDENVTTHRLKWRGSSYANFQTSTPWINSKTSNALTDWTNIDALEQIQAAIVDPWTGEPIQMDYPHLICARDTLYAAKRILAATTIDYSVGGFAVTGNLSRTRGPNPVKQYQIVTSLQLKARLATDTSWFIGNIGKAVKYMQNWPLGVEQAPNNTVDEFDRDIAMQWKASERGAAAVVEPRYLCKSAA